MAAVNLDSLYLVQRYTLQVKAKTRAGKVYLKELSTGLCEANDRECSGRAVALYADGEGHGIQLCAEHERQYCRTRQLPRNGTARVETDKA